MGKPTICIGENKDADQLCGNRDIALGLSVCGSAVVKGFRSEKHK